MSSATQSDNQVSQDSLLHVDTEKYDRIEESKGIKRTGMESLQITDDLDALLDGTADTHPRGAA